MEEDGGSWLRRTKFSHTVCHRLDALDSLNLSTESTGRSSGPALKSRPESKPASRNPAVFSTSYVRPYPTSLPVHSPVQINPITNKQRSLSPLPQAALSDTFKEARSDTKRFSTPHPRKKESSSTDKWFMGKFFHHHHEAKLKLKPISNPSNISPLRHLASTKPGNKSKHQINGGGGGRVNAVEAADEHSVDMDKLFLGQRFAHGVHSRLYRGEYKEEAVAVKIIRVPDDDESGSLAVRLEKQFNREVSLLSRLHHKNVIKFVAACKNFPVYCVITEYLLEGSLRGYLHKLEHKKIPLPKVLAIALDIARGMEYIHSEGVIHRDLKPENVLIDQDFHLKIADFGIACEETYRDPLHEDAGTYRWMAPEMIKHKPYSRKVDVYSFGLILWEMVAGTIPYEDMNPIQAAFAVMNKNLRPVMPGDCPPCMRALIEQCWSLQQDKRPEFWQVVKLLEQFESFLSRDGSLNLVQSPSCQDHKKGLLHWIQKLAPAHPHNSSTHSLKPKFI